MPAYRLLRHALLPLLLAFGQALPAHAAEGSAVLERIRSEGEFRLGYRSASIPFSYVANGEVIGYSNELALRVVEAVRRHLELPDLPLRLVPITPHNRMAMVSSGRVDLECGSTTHNREREAQVGFSNTIFIAGTRLMVRADSGIRDFSDLVGRRIVTTAGTTSETVLRRAFNSGELASATIVSARDHAESFMVLAAGRADAFMMDDALLHGELAKRGEGGRWIVTGTPRSYEAYACMLDRGDPAFKKVVDDALAGLMRSGEAARIYARWFTQPIPPLGHNLNLPMSAAMQTLYATPNDTPFE